MLVFPIKFENGGIKIARVNSFASPIYQFTLILHFVGVRSDVDIFKLTARAQSNNSESICTVLCYSTFCSILKNKLIFCLEDLLLVK